MPKALFFNVPAHGHVNPSLPLVAELVRRGHQVTYFLTEGFRADVEAAGAVLQPYATVRDDYFAGPGLDGSRPQKAACRLITTAGEILPQLLQAAASAKPDYILYDGMCPWGYLAARSLRLPAVVSLSLLPLALPPARDLLTGEMLSILGPMMLRDFGTGVQAARRSRALGARYGVAPLGLANILNAPGDLAISYTSTYFQPYAERVADTVRFVGWTLREGRPDGAFSLEAAQGRRLIYISLGSLVSAGAAFFRTCIDAFGGRDEFVLISTGNRFGAEEFGALPSNVCGASLGAAGGRVAAGGAVCHARGAGQRARWAVLRGAAAARAAAGRTEPDGAAGGGTGGGVDGQEGRGDRRDDAGPCGALAGGTLVCARSAAGGRDLARGRGHATGSGGD